MHFIVDILHPTAESRELLREDKPTQPVAGVALQWNRPANKDIKQGESYFSAIRGGSVLFSD